MSNDAFLLLLVFGCFLLASLGGVIWFLVRIRKQLFALAEDSAEVKRAVRTLRQDVRLLRSNVPVDTMQASPSEVSPTDATLVISRR